MTALTLVFMKNNLDVATMLFMHPKINFDIKDKDGKAAFDFANTSETRQLFAGNQVGDIWSLIPAEMITALMDLG